MRREKISGIVPKLFNPLIKGRRKLNVNKCKVLITFFNILYYLWHLSPCYIAPTSQLERNFCFFRKTPLQCWVRTIALENILRVLSHLLPLENDHFTPGWKQVIASVKVGVERAFNVIASESGKIIVCRTVPPWWGSNLIKLPKAGSIFAQNQSGKSPEMFFSRSPCRRLRNAVWFVGFFGGWHCFPWEEVAGTLTFRERWRWRIREWRMFFLIAEQRILRNCSAADADPGNQK